VGIVVRALRASGWHGEVRVRLLARKRLFDLFHVSGNLIIRSFFVQFPFMAYTALSATLGDVVLAANAILMQFFLMMAYGLDGVSHTAETLTGHAFGARKPRQLRTASAYTFAWGGLMALATTCLYAMFGSAFVGLMTQLHPVQAAANQYLAWAIVAPVVSVWAFVLDGIFIGTTRTAELRNSMFGALLAYLASLWLTLDALGNHAIWLSMMVFMVARGILLGAYYPRLVRLAASSHEG
jgi:MATE family multidrug resistance protein